MKDPPGKNVLFPAAVPSFLSGVFGVAINNRGEVLLEAILRPNSAPRAFLFSQGTLKELPPPPRSGPAIYTYTGLPHMLGRLAVPVHVRVPDQEMTNGRMSND